VPKIAGHLIALFDIVWDYVREHGDRPPRRAIMPEWTARTGLTVDSLKQYIVRFTELVAQYRKLHPEIDVHPFIDVIQKVTQERAEREPKKVPKERTPATAFAEHCDRRSSRLLLVANYNVRFLKQAKRPVK